MHLVPREVRRSSLIRFLPLPLPSISLSPLLTIFSILPHDPQLDKLVISQLGFLAQRRLARGLLLNHSEACVGLSPALPLLQPQGLTT
ncbi:urease subunit gamma [bacterium]|nr:urease subunit gamma [bacterium]